jgi:phosphoglycerate kinase
MGLLEPHVGHGGGDGEARLIMAAFKTIADLEAALGGLGGRPILVRSDLNVPMADGKVTDRTRIEATAPTIRHLADAGAKVVVLAHFGRPKGRDPKETLRPVAQPLSDAIGRPVRFADDCVGEVAAKAIADLPEGGVLLLENLRFHAGEEKNDPAFVKALAALADGYVNDAFSTAHRAHASTEGLAHVLPSAAGLSMQAELEALDRALSNPARPVAAIVGGAKVSTKLEVLGNLVRRVDMLVIGGGMANTFLFANGVEVGRSLCERDLAGIAREITEKAKAAGCEIVLPVDAVVADRLEAGVATATVAIGAVPADKMILDIGPRSVAELERRFAECRTVLWNGPLGAFETAPFDAGTNAAARAVGQLTAEGKLLSVAGGGDTVAALHHAGVAERFSYISTAGGAFLEWLEGKTLPGVKALER